MAKAIISERNVPLVSTSKYNIIIITREEHGQQLNPSNFNKYSNEIIYFNVYFIVNNLL